MNDRARSSEHNSENHIKKIPSGSKVTEISKLGFTRFLGSIIWKIPMCLINIH